MLLSEMTRTVVVVCREVVRDARTGRLVPGLLLAVYPDGHLERYDTLEEAAEALAFSNRFPSQALVPEEEGWQRVVDLPPLMRVKFTRLYEKKLEMTR